MSRRRQGAHRKLSRMSLRGLLRGSTAAGRRQTRSALNGQARRVGLRVAASNAGLQPGEGRKLASAPHASPTHTMRTLARHVDSLVSVARAGGCDPFLPAHSILRFDHCHVGGGGREGVRLAAARMPATVQRDTLDGWLPKKGRPQPALQLRKRTWGDPGVAARWERRGGR